MSDEELVFRRHTAKAEIRPLVYRLGFGNTYRMQACVHLVAQDNYGVSEKIEQR